MAILGSTGKTGGWVLEEALKRGHAVRCLVRKPAKLVDAGYGPDRVTCVQGSATDGAVLAQFVEGADVIVSALGSPSKAHLIMRESAEALVQVLEAMEDEAERPRLVWLTTVGVNEATRQGHMYGCCEACLPSCSLCCGYGCMGCLIFKYLIPKIIGQGVWDDMGESELELRKSKIIKSTTIVRPTNMTPTETGAPFSDQWRKAGGPSPKYKAVAADKPPPNMVRETWYSIKTCGTCVEHM